ncbi:MAG: alpha/beta fold hydrolase [Alphaproteobacteria bacterium]|nr:alpha/beta fold hydrolase [Alphaproteobacteria bacterium]
MSAIAYRTADIGGPKIFYREAGPQDAPALLLLHGFPTSSHMYRHLIPALADAYRVIAPDLPGFGFSDTPDRADFSYTFENLTSVIDRFTDAIGLGQYALFVFDYGAPGAEQLSLARTSQCAPSPRAVHGKFNCVASALRHDAAVKRRPEGGVDVIYACRRARRIGAGIILVVAARIRHRGLLPGNVAVRRAARPAYPDFLAGDDLGFRAVADERRHPRLFLRRRRNDRLRGLLSLLSDRRPDRRRHPFPARVRIHPGVHGRPIRPDRRMVLQRGCRRPPAVGGLRQPAGHRHHLRRGGIDGIYRLHRRPRADPPRLFHARRIAGVPAHRRVPAERAAGRARGARGADRIGQRLRHRGDR